MLERKWRLAVSKIRDILRIAMDPMSLETPVGNNDDATELGDFLADESIMEPGDAASRELLREQIRADPPAQVHQNNRHDGQDGTVDHTLPPLPGALCAADLEDEGKDGPNVGKDNDKQKRQNVVGNGPATNYTSIPPAIPTASFP